MHDLQLLISKIHTSFVALSETWVNQDNDNLLQLCGYKTVYESRKDRIGGCVATMVREGIIFHTLNLGMEIKHTTYEGLFVNVPQERSIDLVIGVIYRLPGQSLLDFNCEIGELFPLLKKCKRRVILIGDFNIDLLKLREHGPTQSFFNLLAADYCAPAITCPTRITDTSSTFIQDACIIEPSVIISDLSDRLGKWSLKLIEVNK